MSSRIIAPTLQDTLALAPAYRMGSRMGMGLRAPRRTGGAAAYRPWVDEAGCVLWFAADDPGVATTSASVTDPTDLSTANWTRTGMSAVGGTLTASATTATVQQVPANFSTGAMQWSATFRVTYVSNGLSDWVALEVFNSALGRAFVNLSTGATGTVGGLVSVQVTPLGGGTYDITLTTLSAGGNYVMIRGASADGSTTCAIGWSATVVNVSIAQTRCSGFLNMVSAASWAEASANLQPRYNPVGLNGRPTLEFGGQQNIISTEAAVLAALSNNADHTLFLVVTNISGNTTSIFSAANSGSNLANMKGWGRGGTDVWRYYTIDNTPTTTTSTDTTGTYSAGSHQLTWTSTSGTVALRQDQTARALDITTNNPTTLTPNRVAVAARPRTTIDQRVTGSISALGLWNVALGAAAYGRVEGYLKAKWLTP